MESNGLVSIGQLARDSGVPVKTIRHYSDVGILPPAYVTEAGYRLYSRADHLRLEHIRTLRGLGFDLKAISALLQRKGAERELLRVQLEAVESGIRNLTRMRVVLKSALHKEDANALDTVRKLDALTQLAGAEREATLTRALDAPMRGIPVHEQFKSSLYSAAFGNIPEELNEEQLAALVEIWTIINDPDYQKRLSEQARGFWSKAEKYEESQFGQRLQSLIADAVGMLEAAVSPSSPPAMELARKYVEVSAEAMGRKVTKSFEKQMLEQVDAHDPRNEQFWKCVAILHGWSHPSPHAKGMAFIHDALRARSQLTLQ